MRKKRHVVFLEDLQSHSVREACLGAAEYAAEQRDWLFDPWPVTASDAVAPTPEDLRLVDGILSSEPAMKRVYGIRHHTRIPRVYFLADSHHPGVPYVSLDDIAVGRMAAEHLISRGYQNFAFIGSSNVGWAQYRGKGFLQVVPQASKHELPLEKLPVYWSWNTARRIEDLHKILSDLRKPCGIFAANDVIACFVIQTARQMGFRVPEDCGIVGGDDDPVPIAAAGMALSSVQIPFRNVGHEAARLLDELWSKKDVASHVRLPPIRVIVRASTDVFMTEDPLVRKAQTYIETLRHEGVSVGKVIRAVGSNRVTLGKRFHKQLDVGILEYIQNRRIEYAKEQLRLGYLNVDGVAQTCGFSSSSYFSKVFRKVTGIAPGQVRYRASR